MTIDTATLRALLAAMVRAQADLDAARGAPDDLVEASCQADQALTHAAVDTLPALLDALDAAEARACTPAERAVIEAASRWWLEGADASSLAARVADMEAERLRGAR